MSMSPGLKQVRRGRHVGRIRENGMRSVGRITRWVVAASLALTAVFSVITDIAFPGRSRAGTGTPPAATTVGTGASGTVRVALPPKNGGANLAPPVAPPTQAPVRTAPVANSGGS
jgi:hypothetical protein